jgi:hypothetical protein
MRKILKLSSDSGDSGCKKCKGGCGGGQWTGLAESAFGGSLESGARFCVGAVGRNLTSVAVKMFSCLIYFIKKFYKFCTLNAICKDNAAINCLTVNAKKS